MSPLIISILLVLALLLPLIGAVVLRLLGGRFSERQFGIVATLVVAVPIISVLVLSRANISTLKAAGVTVLQTDPTVGPLPDEILAAITPEPDEPHVHDEETATALAATGASATARPAATPRPSAEPTEQPTAQPTTQPTEAPTATVVPPTATAVPPTATAVPPTATAVPAPAPPAGRRTYVVQSGDTLRGIAAQFNVSVPALLEANNLTPAQADSLRLGQELVIP